MLRRSILISMVVGTILVTINQGTVNQGTVIVAGGGAWELAWKIPLTYRIPFYLLPNPLRPQLHHQLLLCPSPLRRVAGPA